MKALFISAEELAEEQGADPDLVLIDTRPAEDYQQGHIPGARNLSEMFTYLLPDSGEDSLRAMEATFTKLLEKAGVSAPDQRVVVYEESMYTKKGASCRGAFLCRWLGLCNVAVLNGGLRAWTDSQRPLTTDVPEVKPAQLELARNDKLMATADDVAKAVKGKEAALLDDRDEDEWKGLSSSPYGIDFCPRKGRIPGAKWLLWTRLMREEQPSGVQSMESPERIRALASEAGFPDPQAPIIVYCFKVRLGGSRAANTMLALESAGFGHVRNYFASWNEWSRDPGRPVDDALL